jgi:surface protein
MGWMFFGADSFNGNLSLWNVGQVTDMERMFFCAVVEFSSDLSSQDVSQVTDMATMFDRTISFNGDISLWEVGQVTDIMSIMFSFTDVFDGDLSAWNISQVTSTRAKLQQASTFNNNIWRVCLPLRLHSTVTFRRGMSASR